MRSLRIATCTSGEPVSPSCVLYVSMIFVLRSLFSPTLGSLHERPRAEATFRPDRRTPTGEHSARKKAILPQDHDGMQNTRPAAALRDAQQTALAAEQAHALRQRLLKGPHQVRPADLSAVEGAALPVRRQHDRGKSFERPLQRDQPV